MTIEEETIIKALRGRKVRQEPTFLYFCLFMLFLISMNLWIGWDGRAKYLYMIFGSMAAVFALIRQVPLVFSWRNSIPLLIISLSYLYISDAGLGIVFSFLISMPFVVLLNDIDRKKCLDYILKWYALLLIIGIFLYIICHMYSLSSFGMLTQGNKVLGYHPYKNFIFYVEPTSINYYWRFNGPFLEPGHLGMMSAFLLLATGFDLGKRDTWILVVATLMSLSLAGYVLAFVAFLFCRFHQGKISLQYVVLYLFVMLLFYLYGTFYDGGDNIINEKIFSRLEADEDRGFTGNNRVFGQIPLYYEMMWSDTKTMLFGYGRETIKWLAETGSRGTGFTMWMVSHGVIGTIAALLFYLVYSLFSKNKLFAFLSFAFVCIVFWQRSYPFWFSWVICYVYGITYNRKISRRLR